MLEFDPAQKRALISVYHKPGVQDFAAGLVALGWEILSSGGTAKFLSEHGVPVRDVAELIGGGSILGHRVVTLSRQIHAGLLARYCPEDQAAMTELGLPYIDLVCCDFYPLDQEIAKPGATIESVIEQTDIGGPTMVRSAAKGGRIVICDPLDRPSILFQLQTNGDVSPDARQALRAKAESTVANYCLDSARFHSESSLDGWLFEQEWELAYGENRCQSPAFLYALVGNNDPLAWHRFEVLAGHPSYISITDGDRALRLMCAMSEAFRLSFNQHMPKIAIVCKHGNACGVGVDWDDPEIAIRKAMMGDAIAAMGGELMVNFPIEEYLGRLIFAVPGDLLNRVGRKNWGMDVVYAPAIDSATVSLLGKKEKRRLLVNCELAFPLMSEEKWMWRPVRGGAVKQLEPNFVFSIEAVKEWSDGNSPILFKINRANAIIAWAVAWYSVSNTVALANDNMLISLGCGQQDRIACVRLCLDRAKRSGHKTQGAMFASDAFFPYARRNYQPNFWERWLDFDLAMFGLRSGPPLEGPELLVQAGCIGGIVPADGKNFEEVRDYFSKMNLAVAFLKPEFRGFFGH